MPPTSWPKKSSVGVVYPDAEVSVASPKFDSSHSFGMFSRCMIHPPLPPSPSLISDACLFVYAWFFLPRAKR